MQTRTQRLNKGVFNFTQLFFTTRRQEAQRKTGSEYKWRERDERVEEDERKTNRKIVMLKAER